VLAARPFGGRASQAARELVVLEKAKRYPIWDAVQCTACPAAATPTPPLEAL